MGYLSQAAKLGITKYHILKELWQWTTQKFNTKDLKDCVEALSGSIYEDLALVIGQNITDGAVEDGVPRF